MGFDSEQGLDTSFFQLNRDREVLAARETRAAKTVDVFHTALAN